MPLGELSVVSTYALSCMLSIVSWMRSIRNKRTAARLNPRDGTRRRGP